MALTLNGTTGVAGVDGSAGTPALQGGDSNTGVFFGTDTVDIATGGTSGLQIDSSQNLKFNSGYGSVATAYGCRSWVNFNGTGTVAIRASANVSSITDNGTGDYTVNFTNAMPDANYSTIVSGGGVGDDVVGAVPKASTTPTTSAINIQLRRVGTIVDIPTVNVSVFR